MKKEREQAVVSDGAGRWLEDAFPISPGDRGESSNTKSREILTINTHTHILTVGEPKGYSTPSPYQNHHVS